MASGLWPSLTLQSSSSQPVRSVLLHEDWRVRQQHVTRVKLLGIIVGIALCLVR